MLILDCESYQSILESLSHIFGITHIADLTKLLKGLNLENIYEARQAADIWTEDALISTVESHLQCKMKEIDAVAWFHLTRTVPGSKFAEGILPLGANLDAIWKMLIAIPGDSTRSLNLGTLRQIGVANHHYQTKTTNAFHFGPYAMLVRESAFRSREMGNHDYLAMPETIEDICHGYQKQFGVDIQSEISDALEPCIVKFICGLDRDKRALVEPALKYCWCKINGEPLTIYSNNCYDARGKTIPYDWIVSVTIPALY